MRISASSDADKLARVYALAPGRINTAVRVATNSVGGLIQRELTGPLALRKYPRHPPGTPTPSPPGEPPAQVSTKLRTTVMRSSAVPVGFAKYSVSVFPTMGYARAQEKGRSEIRLPARPFVAPTRQRVMDSGAALRLYQSQISRRLFNR